MKKIILFLGIVFLVVGCKKTDEDLINSLNKKIDSSNNYQMIATLSIWRNEEKFEYDVISTYKKESYFKVDLINKENNHEQMILRNENSVYVLTPSLNKSFKFQSEWPYNNSQIYLLQPIVLDVLNDKNSVVEKTEEGYIVNSAVNYTSEKDFKSQKIYFDKDKNIKTVEILDSKGTVKMCLDITSVEFDVELEDDYFDINKYQKIEEEKEKESNNLQENTSATIEEIIYPMYVPVETYLTAQDVINTENGERVILTFGGESNFILVEENINEEESSSYIYGEPYLIMDTVGAITDYSVSWISNGVEYSVISETMDIDELLTVAQSINVIQVGK